MFIYWKQGLAGLEFWVDKAGLEVTNLHSFAKPPRLTLKGIFKNSGGWGLGSRCVDDPPEPQDSGSLSHSCPPGWSESGHPGDEVTVTLPILRPKQGMWERHGRP